MSDNDEDFLFQSTRPRGTRRDSLVELDDVAVSIHASARDATLRLTLFLKKPSFNPRVRAGRDKCSSMSIRGNSVSIHASARDATSDAE